MSKKALLVGINYNSIPECKLYGCINDVNNMKKTLIDNYGYTENDIILLSDDQTDPALKPTARNIIGYLLSLIQISANCNEIWFHYSGHGSQIRDTNGDEASGMDSVIVPLDFKTVGVITDDLILQIIKYCKCAFYMLFDSCNSGTVADLQYSFEYANNKVFKKTINNRISISNPKIYSISGSKDTQTSADVYDPITKQYYGACTNALLATLKSNNYNASIIKVYSDLCIFLSKRGYSQKPIMSCSSSNPTASFTKVIARKGLLLNSSTQNKLIVPTRTRGAEAINMRSLLNNSETNNDKIIISTPIKHLDINNRVSMKKMF